MVAFQSDHHSSRLLQPPVIPPLRALILLRTPPHLPPALPLALEQGSSLRRYPLSSPSLALLQTLVLKSGALRRKTESLSLLETSTLTLTLMSTTFPGDKEIFFLMTLPQTLTL